MEKVGFIPTFFILSHFSDLMWRSPLARALCQKINKEFFLKTIDNHYNKWYTVYIKKRKGEIK